jgi:hypothetical protein
LSHNELEGTVVKRFVVAIVCLVGLVASAPVQAATILLPTTDTVVGTFAVDFIAGTTTVAISGAAAADIEVDGVTANSGLIDADALPGTADALFFDLVDEALQFDFNLATSVGLGTGVWTLLAAGSPLSPIGDPALAAFLATDNSALFTLLGEPVFTTDPETQQTLSALFTYSLESITAPAQVAPIPEPATIGLVGMGILAAARARRTRRKHDVV